MTGRDARLVAPAAPAGVRGKITVPGDKSVSHRALLLTALAEGRSILRGLSDGDDVRRTAAAVTQFGAGLESGPDGAVSVDGGRARLHEPAGVVDVGNAGTAIRLLAGWAAGLDGLTVLTGDESIARRPMGRVAEPLRSMGAIVDGRAGGTLPPLAVRGGNLHGIDYRMPVASAQAKGALLLAGLAASGPTTVRERTPTRAHTEEMLLLAGAEVLVEPGAVTVQPGPLTPFDMDIPGDPSQAAFWLVAACVCPGSDVTVERVYVGPQRTGFIDVLRRMGADLEVLEADAASCTATLRARHSSLHATDIEPDEVPGLIDEVPALAVAAAYAEGITTFSGAAELRVKESDRIASVTTALARLEVSCETKADGLVVRGSSGRPIRGGEVASCGDHRVAMAMAVAALGADSPVTVLGWDAVATSYPGFEADLDRCASSQ